VTEWQPARERYVAGFIERQCNKCSGWWRLAKMRKAGGCLRGRSNECAQCYNDRKRLTRGLAKARIRSGLVDL
jgi:hypothetical protein